MADIKFLLDGKEVNPPLEWRDTSILAAWINSSVQPKLITDEFTFVNEAREYILDYIKRGETTGVGIFRGIPFQIQTSDVVDGSVVSFDGYLDFLGGLTFRDEKGVKTKITRPEDLELLNKRLEALSYAYLLDKGHITKKDYSIVPYVIQQVDPIDGYLYLAITEFIVAKETLEAYERMSKAAAAVAGVTTTAYGVLVLVIAIIYFAAMLIFMIRLLREMVHKFAPQPKIQFAMSYRKLLEKAFSYIGYEFDSNISELDMAHYIPSRTNALSVIELTQGVTGIKKTMRTVKEYVQRSAIPQPNDFGYRCSEMVELVMNLFNAKLKVEGNKVYLYTESDPFWIKQSKFKLPDVLLDEYSYNVEEAVSTKLFSFQTDTMDEWTIEDFTGTNFEVNTQSTQSIDRRLLLLKGYKDVRWPVALASRYAVNEKVSDFLDGIYKLAQNKVVDRLFKNFKLANPFRKIPPPQLKDKGVFRVSGPFWGVPKIIMLKDNKFIPLNHRDLISARVLYTKYHSYNSFAYPYTGQRKKFRNITIPFGLDSFNKCQYSSYFETQDGRLGRFERLEWKMGSDTASVDFELFEPYIKTLKETNFEP